MHYWFLSFLAFFLFCQEIAFAKDPKFISSKHIPTAAQALQEWNPLPKKNPYSGNTVNAADMENYAEIIAAFERYFPGAQYAVLGRDASYAGWVLDGFYTQIGQPNRVIYLKGSSGTIKGSSHEDRVKFLESQGIDLSPKNVGKTPPVVFIDSIMNGDSSQVGYLLETAFDEYEKRGGKREDLAKKMVGYNMDGGTPDIEQKGFKKEFSRIVGDVKNQNRQFPEIISSSTTIDRNGEWHGGFGNIKRHGGGKYWGTVYPLHPIESRRDLLANLYEILKGTGKKSFLKAVKKEAKARGYEFPMNGFVPPPPPKPKTDQDLVNELTTLTANMKEYKRKKGSENQNAIDLIDWIEKETSEQGEKAFLVALPVLHDLKKAQKIGTQDMREILAAGLSEIQVDEQLAKDLEPLVEKHSRIARSLKEESEFFLGQEGTVAENYKKLLRKVGPLRSCYKALQKTGNL